MSSGGLKRFEIHTVNVDIIACINFHELRKLVISLGLIFAL